MPTIQELDPQCLADALRLAQRRAAQHCTLRCRLGSRRCDTLADDAVAQVLIEFMNKPIDFVNCEHFRNRLILQARSRVIDFCEQAGRAPGGLPIESPSAADAEEQQRRRAGYDDHPSQTRFQDLDDSQVAVVRHCRAKLSEVDQQLINFLEKHGKQGQKMIPLDRIQEAMELLQQDQELWALLELPPYDSAKPYGAAYQRLRNRLQKIADQLKKCILQQLRPETEGQA